MKLQVTRADLLRALARCQSVADAKSTMPILGNVVLVANSTELTVGASDIHRSIVSTVSATIDRPGAICLSATELFKRVGVMPDGMLAFSVEGTKATIKSGSRRFTMDGIPADEFPSMPTPVGGEKLEAVCSTLASIIGATVFSVSTDQSRIHLNGMLIESDAAGVIRMVSTDGHRLTVTGNEPDANRRSWLVPLVGCRDIQKLLGEHKDGSAVLTESTGTLFLTLPGFTFSVKLYDAQFPPYQQVIPSSSERAVTLDRVALVDALKAVSIASNDRTGSVKFVFRNESLRLEAQSAGNGEGFDELTTDYHGDEAAIGCCSRYVLDVLQAFTEESVTIETSGELDPIVIRPATVGGYLGVVMPIRC